MSQGKRDVKAPSVLKRILVNCAAQAKEYGRCVAAKVPEIEHDMCSKEFLSLKTCMSNTQYIKTMDLFGSGMLSHVHLQHPPLWCGIPETRGLFYDDGNKLLLSPTSDQVLSWKIGPSIQHDPPNSDSINDGPVLSVRISLDGTLIGIKRSNAEIDFKSRITGEIFTRKYKPDCEVILGFFFADCPVCNIVIIKSSGLDLLSYESASNTLHLVEAKRFNVSWYVYTHESRLILLASGNQCKLITGFQFSSGGIVRLPKFEIMLTKTDESQRPILSAEDMHIIVIYGKIYCLQHDRPGGQLQLYRFYRDAVIHQGSIPVYSSKVAVSTVDNVVLVHQVEAKVVILYDLFLDSMAPISAPLPLLLRGSLSSSSADMDVRSRSGYEGTIYGPTWSFFFPDIVCDIDHGLLWKLNLDVEAIATSCSDVPSMLEFLQRRRSDPAKIKQLCVGMMRTLILERRSMPLISRATDVLATSYSELRKNDRTSPEESIDQPEGIEHDLQALVGSPGSSSVAISPEEMYRLVFLVVEEEMTGDLPYLVSVIVEYLRSASNEKIMVPAQIFVMIVQLLAHSRRHAELAHFITTKIIEPSKEVALQLIELGENHAKTRKLGVDLLRRLSLHHDYVLLLLKGGQYLEAMRYARKNKVTTVHPATFLEAAASGAGGSLHLASALRFFSDFIPGFKGTLDHAKYSQMLSLMA